MAEKAPVRVTISQAANLFRSLAYVNKASQDFFSEVTTAQVQRFEADGRATVALAKRAGKNRVLGA